MTISTTPTIRLRRKRATTPAMIKMMPAIQSNGTAAPFAATVSSDQYWPWRPRRSPLDLVHPAAWLRSSLEPYALRVTRQVLLSRAARGLTRLEGDPLHESERRIADSPRCHAPERIEW